ncbi:glycosyltransferase involved in cell wall biosynthesis [Kibdelosporangium banguiense]|uniref:Glycosyltransferase involved in cell wall biosynthesis n=1 Tax=Kibdelosporangium banguiense TaxID=1365924 RepID=A0ABS4U207_9PSEU|nr:HAD-IIIA family hydrolase [Kibdelosporangium banguiense]MBP2330666.1 glycosyltransferase involved in cell wall biosynthesis [Kibdelosporangium banguiense]
MGRQTKAVLFDRDGTLIKDVPYNGDPERVQPFPTTAQALGMVRAKGIRTGVLTNQSGVARKLITTRQVNQVNARVEQLLVAAKVPLDIFGMGLHGLDDCAGRLRPHGDLARRRVYLHTTRWTSLGLSLIAAMHLAMPVVALATTEALRAVPTDCGLVSIDVDELAGEPESARRMGKQAREYALAHYGLTQFLDDWDELMMEVSS